MSSSRTISANGIEIFLLEQGEGPLVVLCHGWPELSYSWRHQIAALAAAGFHVVAPDMRGFGRTSAPVDISAYSIFDTVGDMVALVAALGENRAAIVGHDWGAPVAWHAALFRPDIFSAVAGLSVPPPRRGRGRPLDTLRQSGITGLIGAKHVADMERVLPNLKQKLIVDGASHWIQQERAAEVNAALIAFLKENALSE